jgi:ubiquinone/menaquinone biosynthesis C-methylase UbiE
MALSILDACCGGRMFWHDKAEPGVVFMDIRVEPDQVLSNGQTFGVHPDVVGDFRAMPFADDTFRMVVFDPPHLTNLGRDSYMALKYGRLFNTWRDDIAAGFAECFRVLTPGGFLIFKWSEARVPFLEAIALSGRTPLFGDRSGVKGNTHWQVFGG